MHDTANGLRRISLPRTWVNKDHQTRLRLLLNEVHVLAKPVRCSPYVGLGVRLFRPTLFEVLLSGGRLAGRERFTSARVARRRPWRFLLYRGTTQTRQKP